MVTEQQRLLGEIESFLAEWPWAESTFGRLAVNNSRLVKQLREGREVQVGTVARVRQFMAEVPKVYEK